jgi:hypothetical protein
MRVVSLNVNACDAYFSSVATNLFVGNHLHVRFLGDDAHIFASKDAVYCGSKVGVEHRFHRGGVLFVGVACKGGYHCFNLFLIVSLRRNCTGDCG